MIRIAWPVATLSPNSRANRFAVMTAKKKARESAFYSTKASKLDASNWVGDISVTYIMHPRTARTWDDDNFIAAMKSARDGIAQALGVNDKRFRTMPVQLGARDKVAWVEVILTPVEVRIPFAGQINVLELKRAETLRQQRPALEHARPEKEVHTMSHCGQYTDSAAPVNGEHSENSQGIASPRKGSHGGAA